MDSNVPHAIIRTNRSAHAYKQNVFWAAHDNGPCLPIPFLASHMTSESKWIQELPESSLKQSTFKCSHAYVYTLEICKRWPRLKFQCIPEINEI